MSDSENTEKPKSKWLKLLVYIGPLLTAVIAIVAAISASQIEDEEERFDAISAALAQFADSADQAKTVAVGESDFEVCVASDVAASVALAVRDSVGGVAAGECRIPAVDVDVSDCVSLKPEEPSGVDIPAVVELALKPLLDTVKGFVRPDDGEPVKAWASGVVEWIDSGRPSIIAIIEDPSSGKLSFDAVVVQGCEPK